MVTPAVTIETVEPKAERSRTMSERSQIKEVLSGMANRMRAITLPVVSPAVSLSRRMSEAQPVNISMMKIKGTHRIFKSSPVRYPPSIAEGRCFLSYSFITNLILIHSTQHLVLRMG
jgi:hypothetical protein